MVLPSNLFLLSFFMFLLSGCYSLEQGYGQAKLFIREEKISDVISANSETPERLVKIKLVEPILTYAKEEIGLEPGGSYSSYIALDSPYVIWVVQAAEKKSLKLKTWWFPFVGSQPYLGFFKKESALRKQKELSDDGFDTVIGGVTAFSLLGFFSDPLYSSMIDNSSISNFIETLIHESVHRTLYLPDHYSFNENLAVFIAKKSTENFLKTHPNLGENSEEYLKNYRKNIVIQNRFQDFLVNLKNELKEFYEHLNADQKYKNDELFLKERNLKFIEIESNYKKIMGGIEIGSSYENSFKFGKVNNAVILSYFIYESKQDLFETVFVNSKGNLKLLIKNLKKCLRGHYKDEDSLWNDIKNCH